LNKQSKGYSKSTKPENSRPAFQKSEFINYDLSKTEKEACKAWDMSLSELDLMMQKLNESSYKISVGWDNYSRAFASFLVPQDAQMENYGLILTGRGTTPVKAIKQVLFKHYNVLGDDWTNFSRGDHEPLDD